MSTEIKPTPCPNCTLPTTLDECPKCGWVKTKHCFGYEIKE